MSLCRLTKWITPKICRLCVYVIINKRSFESFMCLDLFVRCESFTVLFFLSIIRIFVCYNYLYLRFLVCWCDCHAILICKNSKSLNLYPCVTKHPLSVCLSLCLCLCLCLCLSVSHFLLLLCIIIIIHSGLALEDRKAVIFS